MHYCLTGPCVRNSVKKYVRTHSRSLAVGKVTALIMVQRMVVHVALQSVVYVFWGSAEQSVTDLGCLPIYNDRSLEGATSFKNCLFSRPDEVHTRY